MADAPARTQPAAAEASGDDEERYAARWRVLWITLFGSFIVPFNIGAINVAIPQVAADLRLSLTEAVWVQTAFLLTVAVLLIPAVLACAIDRVVQRRQYALVSSSARPLEPGRGRLAQVVLFG